MNPRIGVFMFDSPPLRVETGDPDTPVWVIQGFEVVMCSDCDDAPMVYDGGLFQCHARCDGPNVEGGWHPSDFQPEWNEVMTMSENGRLMVVTYG